MKLLLSTAIVFGTLALTQNSYGKEVTVTGQGASGVHILPCGNLSSKQGLTDGTCKKAALSDENQNKKFDKAAK